jgi:hypothetical protein
VVNLSRWARIYCLVFNRYFRMTDEVVKLQKEIVEIIAESNNFIIDSLKELSLLFESGQCVPDKKLLESYKNNIYSKHGNFVIKINNSVKNLYRLYNVQIFEPLFKLLRFYS